MPRERMPFAPRRLRATLMPPLFLRYCCRRLMLIYGIFRYAVLIIADADTMIFLHCRLFHYARFSMPLRAAFFSFS